MRRMTIIAALFLALGVSSGAWGQSRDHNFDYRFSYSPVIATDTFIYTDVNGKVPSVFGFSQWAVHIRCLDTAVYGETANRSDSVEFTVYGSRADTGDNKLLIWDSLRTVHGTDTSAAAEWPKSFFLGDSTYGAIVQQVWMYNRLRLRVAWFIDGNTDTDSVFAARPRYDVWIKGNRNR